MLTAVVRASTKETFMAGLRYQLLKFISHPVSVFFFFGSVVFSAVMFVIYHEHQAEWDTQRHNLDSIINIYQSYTTGGEVKDSNIRFFDRRFYPGARQNVGLQHARHTVGMHHPPVTIGFDLQ
ncbi:hypothetical protein EXD76_06020 [BEV proteobacterium]|nr:hypothetical protein [Candidatus Symbiopectobacterium sp. Chty_BC]